MIVSNTTPISNLLHLDKTSILRELFGTVCIPKAVSDEMNWVFAAFQPWGKCLEEGPVVIVPISNPLLVQQMVPLLHQGEAETICLALENKAKLCLMDDKDGRLVAQSNHLAITGTLGILLKAKQSGLLTAVKPLINELRIQHHFWVTEEMYVKILTIAKEE